MLMIVAVGGELFFLGAKDQAWAFEGFFLMFMLLFPATGVGNASTFQMIPNIMAQETRRLSPDADSPAQALQAGQASAAINGFTSPIPSCVAFFFPSSYRTSLATTGGPEAALMAFIAFYLVCAVVTWWYYTRKNARVPC